jgi:hypothetical protein
MFHCPACNGQITVGLATSPEHTVGSVVLVNYDESVPLESSDTDSDPEELSAPAIVLSKPGPGKLCIAWLLPVDDVKLKAGERRPVRWQKRGPTTHVLDCNTVVVNTAEATAHPDTAGFVIDPAVVFDSNTSRFAPDVTYAAFLGSNMQ